jgi:hypothetical protein
MGGASTESAEVDSTAGGSMAQGVGSTGVPALAAMVQDDSTELLAVDWTARVTSPVPAISRGLTSSGLPTEASLGLAQDVAA